jgi:hypothetical protein
LCADRARSSANRASLIHIAGRIAQRSVQHLRIMLGGPILYGMSDTMENATVDQ